MNHVGGGRPFHAVQFYESKETLCGVVAEFIGEGIAASQPAIVIARPEHRDGILDCLRERGVDVDVLQADGDLLVLDARTTLSRFMVDGQLNAALFEALTPPMIERLTRGRRETTIWAYGEMVDLLWQDGQPVAAILLELWWNKLAAAQEFCLLCGYSTDSTYEEAYLNDICSQHTHVIGANGAAWATGERPSAS
jgi:DcmR-like sensory protein